MHVIGKGSSNGIDTVFFNRSSTLEAEAEVIRSKSGIRKNDIVFSFVGRIVKDKGISELIEAFKILLAEDDQSASRMFLLLIGPFEEELDPLSPEDGRFLQTHGNVVLAGFQLDVRPWMVASDVFVFPSYREGFPNVVMQAACLEVPCIVSDINGCNEIIQREQTGLVVEPKNAAALAQAMRRMQRDVRQRRTFAVRARETVVANYDQRFVWGELLTEYRHMLNSLDK
jgi:glycosyltransferase involved in cell wall biosynthesis